MTNADTAPKDPLALLWQIARMWIADAIAAFGAPADAAQMLARKTRAAVKRRIKALEALVMKLLLIEAGRLAPASGSQARATAKTVAAGRVAPAGRNALYPLDLARPETWRVRFALRIPPQAREPWTPPPDSGPRIRDLGPPRLVADIFADMSRRAHLDQLKRARASRCARDEPRERARAEVLARRFEALRRVIANPAPYARQLLHKLNALKQRAYDAAMRIAMALPPPNQLNPAVFSRAEFHAVSAVPRAVGTCDSS